MDLSTIYNIAKGPDFDLFSSWEEGRQAAFDNKIRKNKLAELDRQEQARPLIGQALQGDKNSLNALAGLDPDAYMNVDKFQDAQTANKRAIRQEDLAVIGKIAVGADTPEKWAAGMDYLAKQGYDIDDDDRNFANRDQVIALTTSQGEGYTLPPGASRYDGNGNLIATAPGRPESSKRRTQVVAVNGRQVLTDLDTGEPIRDLGQSPSRSRVANNDQNNAAGFYDRMVEAEKVLGSEATTGAATDMGQVARSNVPFGAGNYLVSSDFQSFDQARRDFINAQLRKESGAAISPGEFDSANKQYFPQPGDSEQVIAQKARNRATAINAMKRTASAALQQEQQVEPQADPNMPEDVAPEDQGQYFDNEMDIPDGATVQDDQGQVWRRQGNQLIPVQ